MGTVLIIEDDPLLLEDWMDAFLEGPHTVKAATTFPELLALLGELQAPLVALVDENFPGGNGAQAAQILREKILGVKLISTSGNNAQDIAWGPDAFCLKFTSIKVLIATTEKLMTA